MARLFENAPDWHDFFIHLMRNRHINLLGFNDIFSCTNRLFYSRNRGAMFILKLELLNSFLELLIFKI